MEGKFINRILTLVFIGLLLIAAFIVIKSIFISIIIGFLLAYIFFPIFKKINKYIKQKDIATTILILLIIFVIAIPLWTLIPVMIDQTIQTYSALSQVNIAEYLEKLLPSIFTPEFSERFALQIKALLGKLLNSLVLGFSDFVVNIPNLLLQFAVVLFTFYFATRDSEKLQKYVVSLSPLSISSEKRFLHEFRAITNSIVYGQVLIGFIQGILLGIMLFILGVPHAIVLTVLAIITSIIPVIGSWLVWIPISLIMMVSGQFAFGIILFLYGLIIVSNIDNVLRPILLSKTSTLPTAVGLVGIIGGLYAFGLVGLILGPLILAYVLIIIDFYRQGKLSEIFKQ